MSQSRPKARREQYHHGDLPQALKALAVRMIAEHGVAAFSMRDAASRLGVAPSAVYRHFADKSELLAAVSVDAFQQMGALWLGLMAEHSAATDGSPALVALARFAAGADAYFQFAVENPALFQLMFGPFGTGSFGLARLDDIGAFNPNIILSDVLDELRDAGVITAASRAGAEVKAHAAIHGLACLAVSGVFKEMNAAGLAAQLELVKEGILGALLSGPKQAWSVPGLDGC